MAVVSAVLWLPDDPNVRASSIAKSEEDTAQASGLQRCLQLPLNPPVWENGVGSSAATATNSQDKVVGLNAAEEEALHV